MKHQDYKRHISAELRYAKAELQEMKLRVAAKEKHIKLLTERLKEAK